MPHVLELLDADGLTAFNLTDRVGTNNPHGLKVWPFSDPLLGFSSGDPVFFEPDDLPGGTLVHQQKRLIESTFRFKVDADDVEALRAGVSELDRLLEQGGTLKWHPDGGLASFIDFETGWTEGLLRAQDVSMLYIRSGDWDGLPVIIWRQPFGYRAPIDSDTNRLRNPSMLLLQTVGTAAGIPAWWERAATFDNNCILGTPTYDANSVSWEVEIDPAQVPGHIIQQRLDAEEGETVTFSIEAMRVAGAGSYSYEIVCLDAAGALVAGSAVAAGNFADAAFTRRSLTKANLPVGTVKVMAIIRGHDGAATLRLRKAMVETGAAATEFVASTEPVSADPAGKAPVPTTAPVAANAAETPGSVNGGTHSYVYTNLDALGNESAPSGVSNVVTVDSAGGTGGNQDGKVNLSGIMAGAGDTVARRIYRTVAGNTGNHKLAGTINDNTTTTFLDNINDASLGADAPVGAALPGRPGRVYLVYNPGESVAPVSFRAKADAGAKIQLLRFSAKSFGGERASRLARFVNGPLVLPCEDAAVIGTLVGSEIGRSTIADADASGGQAVSQAVSGGQYARLFRVEYDDVDVLEGFRGPLRVTLRCRLTGKAHIELGKRWADSMEQPATYVSPPVDHNTNIDGLATFGYVLVDLGTIAIPEQGALEGLAIEVWAKSIVAGTLVSDCLILSPVELGSTVSLPYAGRAQVAGETMGPGSTSIGSNLGASRWRVTWRYSVSGPSATYKVGFRVRTTSGAGTIVSEIQHAHANVITNITTQIEFESVAAVAYFTSRDVIAGTGTLTVHEVYVERVCMAEEDEVFVTDPSLGEDRSYLESMDGRLMCEAFPLGPTPFWLEPGWSAITVDPLEPRIGGVYPDNRSELRRMPEIGHSLAPPVRLP